MGNIYANQKQLSRLPEVIPVSARVCNYAGSQTVGLLIDEAIIWKIKASDFVKDLRYTSLLAANFAPEMPEQEDGYKVITITGLNDISAFPVLSADDIQFEGGFSTDFLQGHEANVIAQEHFLEDNMISFGDIITLSVYSFDFGKIPNTTNYRKIANVEVKVVGRFTPSAQASSTLMPSIICPMGWVEDIHTTYSIPFYADSAVFVVNDPLHLNDFKSAMKEYGLILVNPQANTLAISGEALLVNDKAFIQSAGSLKKNLTLMHTFLPLILIIVILVGYIASYLLIQSRRNEFAIMRSLGTSRKNCEAMLSVENLILALFGCLIGTLFAVFITSLGVLEGFTISIVFVISYMSGSFFAVHRLGKFSVMEVLTKAE